MANSLGAYIFMFIIPLVFIITLVFVYIFEQKKLKIFLAIEVAVWIFFGIILFTTKTEMRHMYSYPIHSISDTSKIEGSGKRSIFYGSFLIKQNDVYKYVADYKDGKKTYEVLQSQSFILESNSVDPKIEVYKECLPFENSIMQFIFTGQEKYLKTEYKIFVPEGTMADSFNIDLN